MLKLVVCIIVLTAVCSAQEHLTCLRTDDVLSRQSPQHSQRALQGSPGKRGPRGQVGSGGSPGQKGEPGIPDDQQIKLLRDQLDSLSQEVEDLKNQSRENRQLAVDVFTKGLYIPPDVYIYRLTPVSQSWQQSQEFCRNWGGTLAVHGVKTRENRKTLIRNLSKSNIYFWIGVNDIVSEGNWVWVNGERASSSELIWRSNEPNGGRNENCVVVLGQPGSSTVGLAVDAQRVQARHARVHFQDFVRNKFEFFKQQSIVIDCVMLREEGGCNPFKRVKTFIL